MRMLLNCSALVLLCIPQLGIAQPVDGEQLARCDDQSAKQHVYSVEVRISGCTGLLDSRRLSPSNVVLVLNSRGMAYSDLGDFSRARADYDEAIRRDPRFAIAFFNRAGDYMKEGADAQAIADYTQVIRLNPKFWQALSNRAIAYERVGDAARAAADRAEAARLSGR